MSKVSKIGLAVNITIQVAFTTGFLVTGHTLIAPFMVAFYVLLDFVIILTSRRQHAEHQKWMAELDRIRNNMIQFEVEDATSPYIEQNAI